MSKLNTNQCPACESDVSPFVTARDINRNLSSIAFEYHRCNGCGLVFIDQIPEDLASHYHGGYQAIPCNIEELRSLAIKERYRLDQLLKCRRSGRLLEIGPWIGLFSINAKDAGFEVDAIEMDSSAVDFLRKVVGIEVIQSTHPEQVLENTSGQYDAIVLWQSLEHMLSPWKVLEHASKALKPGGVLLVSIPNIDSLQFRITRDEWYHLDAPRHLFFWGAEDLSRLCRSFGLTTLMSTTHDKLSYVIERNGWFSFVSRRFDVPVFGALVSKVAARLITAFSFALGKKNSGACLTAIFNKPGAVNSQSEPHQT